jgi:hypothetical protein
MCRGAARTSRRGDRITVQLARLLLRCMGPFVARRVISLPRSNYVALGAKRTSAGRQELDVQRSRRSRATAMRVANEIHWSRPGDALLLARVEHVREQWSLEVVEYDHAENNDESSELAVL